jgi:hypothetical protein
VPKQKQKSAKKHVIKTAIIVDYMGHGFGEFTPEDEIEEHTKRFSEFAAPAKLKVYAPKSTYPGSIEVGTDLVIYDFGGIGPGATGLMSGNARHLLQWAQDNPNSLVVIVSEFTYRNYVKIEAEDSGLVGELHNIVVDDTGFEDWNGKIDPWYRGKDRYSPFPEWFEKAHGISSKEILDA